ncbi:hypothetical protein I2486_03650 [Cellulophaga sp. E16_2]|uniref:hypothetical protein n=1 Tax=Cellulophaga sp. E16_2 TaxID=2789297 RepID=UPI001A918339|nr:hypothetical protein [Cellulophaga sp. E16_2]MBO0590493.1 hypothetical protein [Cellulophaga sp. E16_2]
MKIEPLKKGQSSNEIICKSFLICDFSTIEEIIATYQQLSKQHKENSVLLTLDDLGQAKYTSSHATMNHNLDNTENYDLSSVDSAAFEDGEHLGYLSTPSEFFIRKNNFDKLVKGIAYTSIHQKDLSLDKEELESLIDVNANPYSWIDEYVIAKIVPVQKSYEVICAFPNGYFDGDLNPFENYILAKRLHEKYGYELFGVGASLLGFIKNEELLENEYRGLVTDLSKLYHQPEVEIEKIVNNKYNLLFLKYTEQLE